MGNSIPINKIGVTVAEGGRHGTFRNSILAAVKEGATSIELSTHMEGLGTGVESYGKTVREELREIAEVNQVDFVAVHVPVEVENLSGFVGKRGFNDAARKMQVDEVKKAIDFAADVTNGCAIVVHAGEYHRPVLSQQWSMDKHGEVLFTAYDEEAERFILSLVDRSSGRIIYKARKNEIVPTAVWSRDKNHNYINYEGNRVSRKNRVPMYDKKSGTFVVKDATWKDFEEEAREMNEEFEKKHGRRPVGDEIVTPAEAFLYATTEAREKISKGYSIYYGRHIDKQFERLNILKRAKEFYDGLEKNIPESEKWRLLKRQPVVGGLVAQIVPVSAAMMPSELLSQAIHDIKDDIKSSQNLVVGQEQTVRKQQLIREQTVSVAKYAMKQSLKSFVDVGLYAMDITHQKNLKKPIFIAVENIFPDKFGGHPEELVQLVKQARKVMAEYLIKHRGMFTSEAKEKAQRHIKATLDLQHLGTWRNYLVQKPRESKDQTDNRFNLWYMEQVMMLMDEGVVGHLHVVDGFGRGHTHLAAGQGIMQVKEAIDYLRESGYRGAIVSEAYGENVFGTGRQLTETLKHLGSFADDSDTMPWEDISQGYFGKTNSLNSIAGDYVPSKDWTLWSGVPLE